MFNQFKIQTIEKPWGYEEIWAKTDKYVGKKIFIKKGHRLSKQYHEIKTETIYVIEGNLTLEFEEEGSQRLMIPGNSHHIPPKTVHRFIASRSDVVLIEVSTVELDDITRIKDDYGRV